MTSKRNAKITTSSQGGKSVPCVRCKSEIQPCAGRAASLIGNHYAHHEGKCSDRGTREAAMHATAQLELFAWSCGKVEPSYTGLPPAVCDVAGSDQAEYAEHMKQHGMKQLTAEPKIKLRSKPAAAPRVPAFKRVSWTQKHSQTGSPVSATSARRTRSTSASSGATAPQPTK